MRNGQLRAVRFGLSVHLARFAVIWVTLAVAPLLGISGWYLGLAANVTCVIFAATLVTVRGLWRTSGILVAWRGPMAILLLVPLMIEAVAWAIPAGIVEQPPGYGLWTLTLLLAATNEELTSRVVVLDRMRTSFGPLAAASFQFRFRWIWPLILLHAGANFATIFSARPLTDPAIAITLVVFIALGLTILRPLRKKQPRDTRV